MSNIDWASIKAEVVVRAKGKSGMTEVIRSAAVVLMADGKEYTVGSIREWVEAGINQQLQKDHPDAEKIEVNWSTVKYTLKGTAGMKETIKNSFKYTPVKKAEVKKP